MAELTKTKIKPGLIELDLADETIVVNFEKQTLDISGPEPVIVEKKPSSKRFLVLFWRVWNVRLIVFQDKAERL